MSAQIELRGICKSFTVREKQKDNKALFGGFAKRQKRVVDAIKDISFSIESGELVGYIGPNGAGKSTTVKVISGILTPEKGSCQILGKIPWKDRVNYVGQLGVVFGQRSQLWWDVPAEDSFWLLREIYGIKMSDYKERLKELGAALDFAHLLKTPVRQLSLGQRMRCEVAAALLHRPKILFLDEPTIGLDAVSKLSLRAFLKEENRKHGVTMILTTHDMGDVEALCTRIMTIGHGQLLFDGSLKELKGRFSKLRCMKLRLRESAALPELPMVERTEREGELYVLWFDAAKIAPHALLAKIAETAEIQDITVEEQDIDQVIAGMYKEMSL